MTEEPEPRLVSLYVQTPAGPIKAAVFHWDQSRGVGLDVLDQSWGKLARSYYERGVPLDRERRLVSRDEGPAFMQALTDTRSTIYHFVDET